MKTTCLRNCVLSVALLAFSSGCGGGGGGDDTPSSLDGRWSGTLNGADCAGQLVTTSFEHVIDAESDDFDAPVELVDSDGDAYHGTVAFTASIAGPFFGFFAESEDKPNSSLFYDTFNAAENEARVSETRTVPSSDGQAEDCEFTLRGTARKEID